MKKSFSSKGKINIDLTSLLDVIFLVLMVVMCYQKINGTRAEAAPPEIVVNTVDGVKNVVLYVTYDDSDITSRHIYLKRDAESDEIQDIVITPETEEASYSAFETKLKEYLSANSMMPVLVTIDDSRILYRDAVRMTELLGSIGDEYTNLYFQGLGAEGNK